ncbi:MAG TPA: hypothetical protein VGT60_02955 [Candidatus Limnocylindria bacterium]|nr:hypothetical protein [Candidatus Limnocylindria bacterium]
MSVATQDGRAAERDRTADQLAVLSGEVAERDAALATLLSRLAVAIREDNKEEVQGYAGAVDPHAVAELLVFKNSTLWGLIEVARNVLVFSPIAVTWFGLATATDAYQKLIGLKPDLVTRPFLLLWQEGFETAGVLKFSTLAIIDASLIGVLIVLSLLIHYRTDIHDVGLRTQVLLKESELRGLIAHALSLSSSDLDLPASAELIDQMVAEERRIYERAMEREQRLFDLESTVRELRAAASDLARAAELMTGGTPAAPRGSRAPEVLGSRATDR